MGEKFKNAISIALLIILILIFYGRLLYPKAQLIVTPDFGKSDSWHSSISAKMLLSEKLKSNQFPLWSQKIGTGVPVFAEGLIGAAFLPNLILFRLFDPVTGITLSYMLSAFIMATGMYVWTRSLGLAAIPSFLAAATVTFSGITIPQLTHLALLPAQALIPWVFWSTRALHIKKTWRQAAVHAAIVSQQILTGYPQAVFIALLFAGLYYLSLFWNNRSVQSLLLGIIALVLAMGGAAIQLMPSREYLSQSSVATGYAPQMASFFSYPFKHLQTLINPFALGNPKVGTYPSYIQFNGSIFWENSGYIGIVPLIALGLALILLVTGSREYKKTKIYVAGAVLSLLLMLGKFSPLYILYSFWPFTLFRVPSRFLWIFVIALVILITQCVNTLWKKCTNPLNKSLFIILSLLHILQLMTTWWDYHAMGEAKSWLKPPETLSHIAPDDRILTIGAETTHNKYFLSHGWEDITPYFVLRNALLPNSNITFGVNQHEAYIGRPIRRNMLADSLLADTMSQTQHEATISASGKRLLDIFSIHTLISTLPTTSDLHLVSRIRTGDIGIETYQNPEALPQAYIANLPTRATSLEEAGRALLNPNFIVGKSVIVEQDIELSASSGSVSFLNIKDEKIEVKTRTDGTAILVIAMTYYPGWLATLDGKATQTLPVNIRQTGIMVPSGTHTIKLSYQPLSYKIGAVISGICWILIVLLVVSPGPFAVDRNAPWPRRLS